MAYFAVYLVAHPANFVVYLAARPANLVIDLAARPANLVIDLDRWSRPVHNNHRYPTQGIV